MDKENGAWQHCEIVGSIQLQNQVQKAESLNVNAN